MSKRRMIFIPELKTQLSEHLRSQGLSDNIINNAFANWEANRQPGNPWERGAFAVFQKVQEDIG